VEGSSRDEEDTSGAMKSARAEVGAVSLSVAAARTEQMETRRRAGGLGRGGKGAAVERKQLGSG